MREGLIILSGAEGDRTLDLLNAMYFQHYHLFCPISANA
jgi:hypothetical protein